MSFGYEFCSASSASARKREAKERCSIARQTNRYAAHCTVLPTTSTLGAEFVPDRYRTLNMVCGSLFFAVGEVLISSSAELIPLTGLFGLERFRCLLLVTTVPAVPGFLMIYFFVPESPHYIEATALATGTESAAQRGNKEVCCCLCLCVGSPPPPLSLSPLLTANFSSSQTFSNVCLWPMAGAGAARTVWEQVP